MAKLKALSWGVTKQQFMMLMLLALALTAAVSPMMAHAIPVPSEGDLLYGLYDVAVSKGLNGPVGFVGGVLAIIFSARHLAKDWMVGGLGILGGSAALKADGVVTTMGMLLPPETVIALSNVVQ